MAQGSRGRGDRRLAQSQNDQANADQQGTEDGGGFWSTLGDNISGAAGYVSDVAGQASEAIGLDDALDYAAIEATKIALNGLTIFKPELTGVVNTINNNDQLVEAIGNYLGDDLSRMGEMASALSPDNVENLTEDAQKTALENIEKALKDPIIAEDITTALNNMAANPDTITMSNFQDFISAAKSFDITNPDVGRENIQQAYIGLGMTAEDANQAIQSIYNTAVNDIEIDTVLAPIVNGDPDMKGVTDAIKANPELSGAIVNYIKNDINAASDIKELFTGENGVALTGDAKIAALKTLEEAINDPEKSALMTKALNNIAADPNDNIKIDGIKDLKTAIDEYSILNATESTEQIQKAFIALGMTEAEANEAIELEALNKINGSGLGMVTGILTAIGLDPSWLMEQLGEFLEMIGVSSSFTNSLTSMFNENGLAELPEFAKGMIGIGETSFQANAPATMSNIVDFPQKFNEATAGVTVMTPEQVREAIVAVDPKLADEMEGIQSDTNLKAQFDKFGSMTTEDLQREVSEMQQQLANGVSVKQAVSGISTPGM